MSFTRNDLLKIYVPFVDVTEAVSTQEKKLLKPGSPSGAVSSLCLRNSRIRLDDRRAVWGNDGARYRRRSRTGEKHSDRCHVSEGR